MRLMLILTFALIVLLALAMNPNASYTVKNLNVTIALNQNTSAQVTEVLYVQISNESVNQYSTNRAALNLTLSNWQALIGPMLVQHVLNPNQSVYDFKFLPGAVIRAGGRNFASIAMSYKVSNITSVNQTAPRQFMYMFNPRFFNFDHGVSGTVLNQNTTMTITVPGAALIKSAYPIPDLPTYSFTQNYKNISAVSWLYGEPLSKFSFTFIINQSVQLEVITFITTVRKMLGVMIYVILAIVIGLFLTYVYYRAVR